MADKKQTPDDILEKETEKERSKILKDAHPDKDVPRRAVSSSNTEITKADTFVGSEKTLPEERASFSRRILVTNHTLSGMPSDVHQTLVATSSLRRSEAMTYWDIKALLAKYGSEDRDYDMPGDIRSHLELALNVLEPSADFDQTARRLLEKYA